LNESHYELSKRLPLHVGSAGSSDASPCRIRSVDFAESRGWRITADCKMKQFRDGLNGWDTPALVLVNQQRNEFSIANLTGGWGAKSSDRIVWTFTVDFTQVWNIATLNLVGKLNQSWMDSAE